MSATDTSAAAVKPTETIYRYQDEQENELFHVVRTPDKRFFQRQPNGTPGLGNTRRVLYRLPRALEHIQSNSREPLYIVEGEKDVLAIEAAGGVATCNPMGAGKWQPEYSETLMGARTVLIIADNDEPGINHANAVRASLGEFGITATVVTAADGKDASDHLAAGLPLADLVPLELELRPEVEPTNPIELETWNTFSQRATDVIPCLVDGLWPVGAFGFIAAPPKKGKTWIGLALAISIATGKSYLGRFAVAEPKPVVYLALEGHRAALRSRIGCLARGANINPDTGDLTNLHIAYKPRGINIADESWADAVRATAVSVNAAIVIVDVLRAAAAIKENSAEEFTALRRNITTITDQGIAVALLHHFGKLTELTKERSPGERMSGSGAMYGALDVGIFITGSDEGARRLRLDFELRDLAEPDTLGLYLAGDGTGENGGFTYRDTARWDIDLAPDEADVIAPASEIAAYVRDQGGQVDRVQVEAYFNTTNKTIINRLLSLRDNYGIDYITSQGGKRARLVARPEPGSEPGREDQEVIDFPVHSADRAKRTRNPEHPEVDDFPVQESADLQGKQTLENPEPYYVGSEPLNGATPHETDKDLDLNDLLT